jgi:anti-sigma factor RsiW
MGTCEDKRFREMLHRYELGRLSAEEQEELERHLLECDECFQDFSEFQKTVEHLRFSPRVKDAIRQLAADEARESSPQTFTAIQAVLGPGYIGCNGGFNPPGD